VDDGVSLYQLNSGACSVWTSQCIESSGTVFLLDKGCRTSLILLYWKCAGV